MLVLMIVYCLVMNGKRCTWFHQRVPKGGYPFGMSSVLCHVRDRCIAKVQWFSTWLHLRVPQTKGKSRPHGILYQVEILLYNH